MAWYCVLCKKEIPPGEEVYARADGTLDSAGLPHHGGCIPGYVAPEVHAKAARTSVTETGGRLLLRSLRTDGSVDGWLELPSSLKQPLMAMAAEVAEGQDRSDFPVPGGDKLVIARVAPRGWLEALHLTREPTGFPSEGRDLRVDTEALPLFITQLRSV